ncbi:SGNH/GDSL hydrolase family protein [Galbibacter mesophilus]|uniref:SGNH/GDSL hydrolase family protein n=1 Tax=Galbibacter mesophilus TaxID=379069 RepID=UPI00191F937E|nr:SGNH/GDSL hydrolase family protein [Galbibacter mesophilus]MCM5662841.1 SGNH/GDSL hydrolase family protein [Galbibacter mesophilus]
MKNYFFLLLMFTFLKSHSQENAVKFANFEKYAVENKALNSPKPDENRVVFYGNSITEGWKDMHPYFFEENPYIDRGISGQTTSQMLLRFRKDVIELEPKAVVFLAGINDIAENTGPIAIEDVFGNIISMVELAQANQIIPIVCSTLPANHFPWRERIKPADKVIELNELLKDYCKKNNVTYVDYYSAMVNKEKGLSKELAHDGVHPTSEGYKIMEPIIQKAINTAVK